MNYPFDIISSNGFGSFNIMMLRFENLEPLNHLKDSLKNAGVHPKMIRNKVMEITKDYYVNSLDNERLSYIDTHGEDMPMKELYDLLRKTLKKYGITFSVVDATKNNYGNLRFYWGEEAQGITNQERKASKKCFTQLANN